MQEKKRHKKVRVKRYDGSWLLLRVIRGSNGQYVKYLGEVGMLMEGGSIDTGYFLKEWRSFK